MALDIKEVIKITGEKLPKYKKANNLIKQIFEATGNYNKYRFKNIVTIKNQNINYTGELQIKSLEEFNIVKVERPISGRVTYNDSNLFAITFINTKNMIVARLFFENDEDLMMIWSTYYQEIREKTKHNKIKELDKINKTNYYEYIFKRTL